MLKNHNIICERRTYSQIPHEHSHPYAQMIVPIHGSLSVIADSHPIEDGQPKIIYLPPAIPHSFCAQESNQFFVFDIPASYLPRDILKAPAGYHSFNEKWEALRSLLFLEVGEEPASNQRLLDLFRYMMKLLEEKIFSFSLKYIYSYYHQPISVQQLARMEHYNPSYYCEWFQKKYGLSPMAYIRKLRLDRARSMLEETDYPLMQIAQQVGYQDQSTLTRLFRQYVGMTPSEYRYKNRKSDK